MKEIATFRDKPDNSGSYKRIWPCEEDVESLKLQLNFNPTSAQEARNNQEIWKKIRSLQSEESFIKERI